MKKYSLLIALILFEFVAFSQNFVSEQKFNNFETFAKLYGYTRYFYPGDEAFINNWDKFAVFGLKKVEYAATSDELKDSLNKIFQAIAPGVLVYNSSDDIDYFLKNIDAEKTKKSRLVYYQYSSEDLNINNQSVNRVRVNDINFIEDYCEIPSEIQDDTLLFIKLKNPKKLFDEEIKRGKYFSKPIGHGLFCIFPLSLSADNEGTMPKVNKLRYRKLKNEVNGTDLDMTSGDSSYVRIADIVIAWNVLEHYYPYFRDLKIDWSSVLHRYLKYAYNCRNKNDFLLTLKKLIVQAKDGQASVYNNDFLIKQYFPSINCEWIDFRLVVTKSWDSASVNIQRGDVILEINNMNSLKLIENEEAYIPGGNLQMKRIKAISNIIRGVQDSYLKIKIQKPDGTIKNIELRRTNDTELFTENSTNKIKYDQLPDGIVYLNLGTISKEEINDILPILKKAKGIICDLRNYADENNNDFICYLLTSKDTSKPWCFPHILYPDFENVIYRKVGENFKPEKPHLSAKFVFITNGNAEYFLDFVSGYGLGTIIGNNTFGNSGDICSFELPGGFFVQYTKSKVLRLDGSQLFGTGIKPDFYVSPSMKGISEGKDELIESAIQIINTGKSGND